jgi:hypothetical protein
MEGQSEMEQQPTQVESWVTEIKKYELSDVSDVLCQGGIYKEGEKEKKWILGILPSGRPLHTNTGKEG